MAVFAQDNRAVQTRPIGLGTSGGNVNDRSKAFCCSGTLGALVKKNNVNYILSNNHVLARGDQAISGDAISQPGLIDVGCRPPANSTVANFFQAPQLGTANVDAALGTVVTGTVDTSGRILDIGVPSSTTAIPQLEMGVAKAGRTTGLTCGSIGSVSTDVSVQYQRSCGMGGKKFTISYTDQVVINSSSFSAGGDSGSLIVSQLGKHPVALLFAGSSTTTIGNPIQDVEGALGITFVGNGTSAGDVNCAAGAGAVAGPTRGPSQGDLHRAVQAKENNKRQLFDDPAVQGVGVGVNEAGEAVVVVYLEEGRAEKFVPEFVDGVRTKVIRTDRFRAYGWNEKLEGGSCKKSE